MSATDAAFAGSIPALYEQYLGSLLFQPYAEVMASRLNDLTQGRVLETAAGTGIVTRALAKALPREVEIVATDLNQAMLDLASGKLQAPNVRWQPADARPFPSTMPPSMRSCASSASCSFPISRPATVKRCGC